MRCWSESGVWERSGRPPGCATAIMQADASRPTTSDILLADIISLSFRWARRKAASCTGRLLHDVRCVHVPSLR
jgi:hypothetical protein